MKKALFTLTLLICFMLVNPLLGGTKEEIIRLQHDILQLQEQIRLLQKNVDEKNGMIVSLLEQLNDQAAQNNVGFQTLADAESAAKAERGNLDRVLSQMRDEMKVITAKLDETNNRVAAMARKMEENQVQIQSLRSVQPNTSSEVEPDRVYSATYNDYLMGNYSLAVNGFQDFLANYPDSEYADNAAYYLGDSQMKQGNHELAIQAFDQVINLYPKADKTPVAYFKKALALEELQRLQDAINTLKTLAQLFPDTPEARLAKEELQTLGVEE